jgi:hypothetical protein
MFVALIATCGLGVLGYAIMHRGSFEVVKFAAFLIVTVFAARLNVRLPGIDGSMSVNLPFILIALTQFNLLETMVIACSSALAQSLLNGRKTDAVKVIFNVCNMANSVGAAYLVYSRLGQNPDLAAKVVLLTAATAAYFLVNTMPVAIIVGLTEKKNAASMWGHVFLWTFPYYLLGAGVASIMSAMTRFAGWQTPLILLPVAFAVYCSYKRYFASAQPATVASPLAARAIAVAAHN